VALSPLVTYRLLEFITGSWNQGAWTAVAQHTIPPLSMLGVTLALWRRIPPLPGSHPSTRPFGDLGVAVAVGVMLGTIAAMANLLLMLTVTNDPQNGVAAIGAINPGAAALVAHVVLLAPVAEELTFRGLIHRIFRQNMLPWSATLLSALIFGLMHVQLGKAVWAFFLGLVTAASYEQTRSLLTPILIHALFNAVPIGVAVLRAKPDDVGPIWLVLSIVAIIFTLSARQARQAREAAQR
jgi:membrane protease YdiL (CAAX protease family)